MKQIARIKSILLLSISALVIPCLSACGTANVGLESSRFPEPLVQRLPVNVAVHYEEALTSFVHEEELDGFGTWRLSLGPAQRTMFTALSNGLFQGSLVAESISNPPAGSHGVLAPQLTELQFSVPRQTRNDVYEVWLKYQMRLFDTDGSLVIDWPVTAYGKASTHDHGIMDGSGTSALRAAADAAMRDAMVVMALRFRSVPEVRDWLSSNSAGNGGLEVVAPPAPQDSSQPTQSGAET
ncbi:MAG: hypothetical protein NXH85_12870 [Pseudomonadaceae bacterium]|nr:hypothetical protein [Pseudomonadaceae bacterium]